MKKSYLNIFILFSFFVFFLLSFVVAGTAFSTVTKNFTADQIGLVDAHVYEYSYRNWNNANWGGAPMTNISSHVDHIDGTRARVYIMFDLDMFGSEVDMVQKVDLFLSVGASQIGLTTAAVHRVKQSWQEGDGTYHSGVVEQTAQAGTISWENQPEFDGQIWSTVALSEAGGPYSVHLDITELVKAWMKGTYPNHGLVIMGEESSSAGGYRFYFGSSENSDETLRPKIVATFKETLTPSVMSLPTSQGLSMYTAIAEPVKSSTVTDAKPVAFGSVAASGDSFDLKIGMYPFAAPVDIYFGIALALYPENIYLLTEDNRFQPLSSGVVPWKSGTTAPFDEVLFSINKSAIPRGTYIFYLLVTPEGRLDPAFLWVSSLPVLDESANVVPGASTELGDNGASVVLSPDFLSEAGTVSMRAVPASSPEMISAEISLDFNQSSLGSGTFTMEIPVSQLPDNDASVVIERLENGVWTPSGMIISINRARKTVTFFDTIRDHQYTQSSSAGSSALGSYAVEPPVSAVYRVNPHYFGLSNWNTVSKPGSRFEIEYTLTSEDKVRSNAEWTNGSGTASDPSVPDYVEDLDIALNDAYTAHMKIKDSNGRQLFAPLTPPIRAIIEDLGNLNGNSAFGGPLKISNEQNENWVDLKTTAAHELIHVLQDQYYVYGLSFGQGINILTNKWFIEATADYFAALAVYPNSADSRGIFYTGKLGGYLTSSLTSSDDASCYAVAHFLDWGAKTYGGNIAADAMKGANIRDVWNLNDALKAKGSSLGQAFEQYGKYLLTHPEDYGEFNVRELSDLYGKSQFSLRGLPRLDDRQAFIYFERDVQPLSMTFLNLPAKNSDKALLVADFTDSQMSDDLAAYLYGFAWKTGSNSDYLGKETLNPLELLLSGGNRVWTVEDVAEGEEHDGFHFLLANGWWTAGIAQKVKASIYLLLPPKNISVSQDTVYWQYDTGNIPDGYIAGYNIYQNGRKLNGDTPVAPLLRAYTPVANTAVQVTVVDKYGNEWPRPPAANASTANMVLNSTVPTVEEQVTAECRTSESQSTGTMWRFNWGDGTVETVWNPVDTHSYNQVGGFNASCVVVPAVDSEITSAPVRVDVKAKPEDAGGTTVQSGPEVSIEITPQFGDVPLTVAATCRAVDLDGTISDYLIHFGEDTVATANGTASYTFGAAGVYNVYCTATDNDGLEGTSATMVVGAGSSSIDILARSMCSVPNGPEVKHDNYGTQDVYYKTVGGYPLVLADIHHDSSTGMPTTLDCFEDDNQSSLPVAHYEWWGNGNMMVEQHLRGQLFLDGVQRWWYEDGSISGEHWFSQNKKNGVFKDWKQQGIMTHFDTYMNDVHDGISIHYCDNGQTNLMGSYRNDLKDGMWKYWLCNGVLYLEETYVNGHPDGLSVTYNHDTGLKESETMFKYYADEGESLRDGSYRDYYDNGKLKNSGGYVKGKKDGIWTYYYQDGNHSTEKYSNGQLLESCDANGECTTH